jgi:hypothetical protein
MIVFWRLQPVACIKNHSFEPLHLRLLLVNNRTPLVHLSCRQPVLSTTMIFYRSSGITRLFVATLVLSNGWRALGVWTWYPKYQDWRWDQLPGDPQDPAQRPQKPIGPPPPEPEYVPPFVSDFNAPVIYDANAATLLGLSALLWITKAGRLGVGLHPYLPSQSSHLYLSTQLA